MKYFALMLCLILSGCVTKTVIDQKGWVASVNGVPVVEPLMLQPISPIQGIGEPDVVKVKLTPNTKFVSLQSDILPNIIYVKTRERVKADGDGLDTFVYIRQYKHNDSDRLIKLIITETK